MYKTTIVCLFSALTFLALSCQDQTSINQDDASKVIVNYLDNKPEYKTVTFKFGEIRFHGRKDRDELSKYQSLEKQGFIKMTLDEQKKIFLSKDSTFIYQVSLAGKSAPLVISQGKGKASVIAIKYVLDNKEPVNFIKTGNNSAKVTVSLKKEGTEFYPFMDPGESNSEFITKTYKLKLKKGSGWAVD